MAYSKKEIAELFDTIIKRIEAGEALRGILKDKELPSTSTFYLWLENENGVLDEEKSKRYMRACEIRSEGIFDEMLDIADDGTNDYMEIHSKTGNPYLVEDKEHTSRSKLRIETRKWILGKMNPKKYSDKLQIDNSKFEEQPLFPDLDN